MQAGSVESYDPITNYLDIAKLTANIDPKQDVFKIIGKRVHSRAWHAEMDRHKNMGIVSKDIGQRASMYASLHLSRWKTKVNAP